jgi:hypothetical protein
MVIVEPGDNIRTAAHQRLQRLGAAGVILQFDVEPFQFVKPQFLRERRRQVDELILAAHREAHVGSPGGINPRGARAQSGRHGGHKGDKGHQGQKAGTGQAAAQRAAA